MELRLSPRGCLGGGGDVWAELSPGCSHKHTADAGVGFGLGTGRTNRWKVGRPMSGRGAPGAVGAQSVPDVRPLPLAHSPLLLLGGGKASENSLCLKEQDLPWRRQTRSGSHTPQSPLLGTKATQPEASPRCAQEVHRSPAFSPSLWTCTEALLCSRAAGTSGRLPPA